MTQAPPVIFRNPTEIPQPTSGRAKRPASRVSNRRRGTGRVLAGGTGRAAIRGNRQVIELEHGIVVYPAREKDSRWGAVWWEDGERRQCAVRPGRLPGHRGAVAALRPSLFRGPGPKTARRHRLKPPPKITKD